MIANNLCIYVILQMESSLSKAELRQDDQEESSKELPTLIYTFTVPRAKNVTFSDTWQRSSKVLPGFKLLATQLQPQRTYYYGRRLDSTRERVTLEVVTCLEGNTLAGQMQYEVLRGRYTRQQDYIKQFFITCFFFLLSFRYHVIIYFMKKKIIALSPYVYMNPFLLYIYSDIWCGVTPAYEGAWGGDGLVTNRR